MTKFVVLSCITSLIYVFFISQCNINKACKLTKWNKWNSTNKYMILWKNTSIMFSTLWPYMACKKQSEWKMDNKNIFIFSKIQCCAICGIVKLINKRKYYKTLVNKYKDVHNQHDSYTPYAIANMIMANYTTSNDKILCTFGLNVIQI